MKRKRKGGYLEERKIKRRNVGNSNNGELSSKLLETPEIHILEHKMWATYKMIQTIIFNSLVDGVEDPKWLVVENRHKIQNIVVVSLNMVSYGNFLHLPFVIQRRKQENPQCEMSDKPKNVLLQKYVKHQKSVTQPLSEHLRIQNKEYFKRLLHQFGYHGRPLEQKKIKSVISDRFSEKMERDGEKMLKMLRTLRLSIDEMIELEFPMAEDSFDIKSRDFGTSPEIKSLDCKMVQTITGSFEIARVSLIRFDESVLIDTFVVPKNPVSDYNTKYSGITKKMLDGVKVRLPDVQKMLASVLSSKDFLVGHSLENDLGALRFHHTNVIDTSILYPHSGGLPYKNSLRFLCQKYLKRQIQNDARLGNYCIEDAVAALDLVKLKINNPAEIGDFNQEITSGNPMRDQSFLHLVCSENVKCYVLDNSEHSNIGNVNPVQGKLQLIKWKCANDKDVFKMSVKQIRENEKDNLCRNTRTVTWINFNDLAELYVENAKMNELPLEKTNSKRTVKKKKKKKKKKRRKRRLSKLRGERKIIKKLGKYTAEIIKCVPRNTIVMILSPHGNLKNVGKSHLQNPKEHYDTFKGFLYTMTKK